MAHTTPSPAFDVCIRGTGIVGLTLARLLAMQGLRVALVGSVEAPAHADVRAYAINHASRDTLMQAQAWPQEPSAVTPVTHMRVFGDDNGAIRFDAPAQDELTWIVDVPALISSLQAVVVHDARISVITPEAGNAIGAAPKAALTVICEGRETASRMQAGLRVTSKRYGHDALATRVMADHPHRGVAWQWFSGSSILGLLPLGGAEGRELAVVWSQSPEHTQYWQQQDPHALGEALGAASHHALGRLQVHGRVATWPLVYTRATRWIAPGLALAGDAAHTVHPLAGQGLNLGLADVASLAAIVAQRPHWRSPGDWKLLRQYERSRTLPTRLMQDGTDALYLLFASDWPVAAPLRNWGLSLVDRLGPLKRRAMAQARLSV